MGLIPQYISFTVLRLLLQTSHLSESGSSVLEEGTSLGRRTQSVDALHTHIIIALGFPASLSSSYPAAMWKNWNIVLELSPIHSDYNSCKPKLWREIKLRLSAKRCSFYPHPTSWALPHVPVAFII